MSVHTFETKFAYPYGLNVFSNSIAFRDSYDDTFAIIMYCLADILKICAIVDHFLIYYLSCSTLTINVIYYLFQCDNIIATNFQCRATLIK